MLKIVFWVLLIANVALFGLSRGFLPASSAGREPERLAAQVNADKIRLLPAGAGTKAPAPAAPAAAPVPVPPGAPSPAAPVAPVAPPVAAAPVPPVDACVQIGNFTAADADLFRTQLAPLQLDDKLTRITFRDITSYIVLIPSQGSRESADATIAELQRLGIADYFVFQDPSPLQWAVSLGVFKVEEAARTHLADLNRKGVRSARIAARRGGTPKFAFQLRSLDVDTRGRVDAVRAAFPNQQARACETPQSDPVLIAGMAP